MKKRIKLSLLCLLLFVINVSASEISAGMALSKGTEIMSSRFASFSGRAVSVNPVMYNGHKAYYVIQFMPQGWILISADDSTEPLIGYSEHGSFIMDDMPETMKSVMDCFGRRITERAAAIKTKSLGWDNGSGRTCASTRAGESAVEPLIPVNWNQSGAYKKYCPSDANGQAIVGCVAVAMAQAMSVARWPERPCGEYSYVDPTYGTQYINYDNEPSYDWNYIIGGSDNKDGAARLLWHCGVSVNMKYGIDGSGTQDSYIVSALQRNFSYPSSVKYYKRSNFSDDEWHELIYNELRNGRAVCLSGQDLKGGYGHCFNLDGYQNGAYHVNWGWGGANNGYFELTSLKDATMNMDYSAPAYQSVVAGIRKPSDRPSDILLSNNSVEANQPAGTVVGDITVENEAVIIPEYTYEILGEYSIIFHKRLPAPFEVKDGKLVTTEVLNSDDGDRNITITVTDQNGASVSRDFKIKVLNSTGMVNIDNSCPTTDIEYYNIDGKRQHDLKTGINIIRYKVPGGKIRTIKRIRK